MAFSAQISVHLVCILIGVDWGWRHARDLVIIDVVIVEEGGPLSRMAAR